MGGQRDGLAPKACRLAGLQRHLHEYTVSYSRPGPSLSSSNQVGLDCSSFHNPSYSVLPFQEPGRDEHVLVPRHVR